MCPLYGFALGNYTEIFSEREAVMRVLRALGVFAFWACCFVLAANVTNQCGRGIGFGLVLITFWAAWAGHSDRSRQMVGLLMEIAERRLSAKVAASIVGVSESRWSEWKSGVQQASFPRLSELPDEIWNEWHQVMLEGQGFVVAASGRLASATSAMLRFLAVEEAKLPATLPRQGAA